MGTAALRITYHPTTHSTTRQYFGGFTVPISQTRGQVSGNFQLMQGDIHLPLKFKAWISPRGEEAPNYVSYTMVRLPLLLVGGAVGGLVWSGLAWPGDLARCDSHTHPHHTTPQIEMPLGYNVINDCPNMGKQEYNQGGTADWLELKQVPNTIARGQNVPIGIEYNLVSENEAQMELSLMSWNWRTHEASQVGY